jgi:indolepyruvate ferredoxin oxidoreductase
MASKQVTLDDKYTQSQGRVYLSGTQALVRLPLMQRARDQAAGLNTGGFISGYRGSPLGGYDGALWRAQSLLKQNNIHFQPGLNEDLAATSIWGTQQLHLFPGPKVDGIFSIWYGKGPGVDRSADVLKHGNSAGCSRHGGVLVVAGDDHAAQSSTLAHQSEHMFAAAMIPVLNPANVQEIIDYGLYGFALSRFSACWVGLKAITETVDSSASVDIDADRLTLSEPEPVKSNDNLFIRWPDPPLEQERRLHGPRMQAVAAFARANPIDRTVIDSPSARLGIMATGKAYLDVRQALTQLGIDDEHAQALGIRLYKVGMSWPLEPEGARAFAHGLQEILVVEEKRAFVEEQLVRILYPALPSARPRVLGKMDDKGMPLLPSTGEITPSRVARALVSRLEALGIPSTGLRQRLSVLDSCSPAIRQHSLSVQRTPFFCSGCPHNTSTQLPEGSRGLAGIGCHGMVQMIPQRKTFTLTQMGGEGATWIGLSPFSSEEHVFQNLGDGTYQHSGLLAIRAAAAAGVNITYKILYNAAVAMTGGQAIEGSPTVGEITRQVTAEGAKKVVVVTDDPARYTPDAGLEPGVAVYHRKDLDRVQRTLRDVPGLTVLVYDQGCAAEKRRTRKRTPDATSEQHVVINAEVCEGCGDCSRASNCMSVLPLDTELGRKRTIDQSGCNKDFSCVEGFCPSFVTLKGARPRKHGHTLMGNPLTSAGLPTPEPMALEQPFGILVTGVGGNGVLTMGAILGMAAHLEGRGCSVLDMTGMAQKNGAVTSHIRIANRPADLHAVRLAEGEANLLLACDPLVAAGESVLSRCRQGVTRAILNRHLQPTAAFVTDNDIGLEPETMEKAIEAVCGPGQVDYVRATALATLLAGDAIAANLLMMGFALQRGLLPLRLASIERAIELNGVSVDANKNILTWGRLAAHDPTRLQQLLEGATSIQDTDAKDVAGMVTRLTDELVAYQDGRYAARYRGLVDRVSLCEKSVSPHSTALTEAVARNLFRLMAYKDEYEVARLLSRPSFMERLNREFEGDFHLEFHLSIPLLERWSGGGSPPRKRRYGGWMLHAFRGLARLKVIRGTRFDPFGYTTERLLERALLQDYVTLLGELSAGLGAHNLNLALQLATLPDEIRGFGHVKHRNMNEVRTKRETLLAAFRATATVQAAPT